MKRNGALDGLRGVAVLTVFMSHTSGRDQALHEYLNFSGIGHIGVYLFFCLSAFLLSLGLFSKAFNTQNIKSFFIKRILRILPLYYLIVTLTFIYQKFSGSCNTDYLHIKNGNIGYIQHLIFYRGDSLFWSIVTEIQFYLIVPFLAYLMIKSPKKGFWALAILGLLSFLLYAAKFAHISDYILYLSPNTLGRGTFIDVFIPGIIAAYLVTNRKSFVEKNLKYINIVSLVSFIGGGLLTLVLVSQNFLGFEQPFYRFRYLSIAYGIFISSIIVSVYMGNRYLLPLFQNKYLQFIGKIGFSFYLTHFAILRMVNLTNLSSQLKFFCSFIIVTLVSYLFYRIVELPSINFSYKIINRYITKKPFKNLNKT